MLIVTHTLQYVVWTCLRHQKTGFHRTASWKVCCSSPTTLEAKLTRYPVDDVTRDFTFKIAFDLIHCRQLLGSFSFEEWDKLYKRAYDNLEPGGWFEQLEDSIRVQCDDGSAPSDAPILGFQDLMAPIAKASGNPTNVFDEMRGRIEKAGFINVQEKTMKLPLGDWPKHPVYKDAGTCNKIHFLAGMEGWVMVSSLFL